MKKVITYLFIFLLPLVSFAQQSKMDSLLTYLKNAPDDTIKVNALNVLSKECRNTSSYGRAFYYGQQAKELAERIQFPAEKGKGWEKGIANALHHMGVANFLQGNYKNALDHHLQALKIREKINDKIGIGNTYNSLAITYSTLGDIEEALSFHTKSLKIMEEIAAKPGMANSYNGIGLLYLDQGNHEQALKYLYKALKIREELNDKLFMAGCYNNIGNVYADQGKLSSNKTLAIDKFQKALDNHLKSLKIKEEIGDKQGAGASYSNIGVASLLMGKISASKEIAEKYYQKALEANLKALQIATEVGDKSTMSTSLNNLGDVCLRQNKLDQSQEYLLKALALNKETDRKYGIMECYESLADLFKSKHDYKQALEYHKLYAGLKDSILDETTDKQMTEINVKYDTEKKDKELIQKDAEISKQQAESEARQTQRNAFIIGFGLVLLLALFVLRGYRQKKAANELLETKNEAINKQNAEIEKKNMVITDSIEYAKNIQNAILPSDEELKKHFPDHFILYQSKDIVSGDFYWIHETPSPLGKVGEEAVLFAVADCTGHGVPGAFMSLMGYNLLNDVINVGKNNSPPKILDELNIKVIQTLKQNTENTSAKYGMDIGLISFNKKTNTIEYAGAHNPLYVFRGKECIQLKADKRSIGSVNSKEFNSQSFQLQKGDMLYLFSDGYVDQLGGPENTKFFAQPFRDLLQSICELDLPKQKQMLATAHADWKKNKKQTDDILVAGIRV